jgi:hypothetical protein
MCFPEVEHILDVKRFKAEAALISDDPLRPLSVCCTIGGANCGLVRCCMCSGSFLKQTDSPWTGRTARQLSIIATCLF